MKNLVLYAAGSKVMARDNTDRIILGTVVGHWTSKTDAGYLIDAQDGRFMLTHERVTLQAA